MDLSGNRINLIANDYDHWAASLSFGQPSDPVDRRLSAHRKERFWTPFKTTGRPRGQDDRSEGHAKHRCQSIPTFTESSAGIFVEVPPSD